MVGVATKLASAARMAPREKIGDSDSKAWHGIGCSIVSDVERSAGRISPENHWPVGPPDHLDGDLGCIEIGIHFVKNDATILEANDARRPGTVKPSSWSTVAQGLSTRTDEGDVDSTRIFLRSRSRKPASPKTTSP